MLDGFKMRDPFGPFTSICDGEYRRNLDIGHGHNNDGDFEMSVAFLVKTVLLTRGDDAVVIKAGRNQDTWR